MLIETWLILYFNKNDALGDCTSFKWKIKVYLKICWVYATWTLVIASLFAKALTLPSNCTTTSTTIVKRVNFICRKPKFAWVMWISTIWHSVLVRGIYLSISQQQHLVFTRYYFEKFKLKFNRLNLSTLLHRLQHFHNLMNSKTIRLIKNESSL